MNGAECPREAEVLESVTSDAWADGAHPDLDAHIEGCAVCAETLEVGLALREDYRASTLEARIPSPGLLWWRAELRVRQEAVRKAAQPITMVQALAAASSLAAIAALAGWLVPSMRAWFGGFAAAAMDLLPEVTIEAGTLVMGGVPIGTPFIVGIGVCLMLASFAAYWILSEE